MSQVDWSKKLQNQKVKIVQLNVFSGVKKELNTV